MPKTDMIIKFMKNCKGFDAVTSKVKYLTASEGACTASVKVELEHTNPMNGLHGGFSATLVDVVSSMGLFTHKYGERPSVSVSINLAFLKGAKIGDELLIDSKTLRVGKNIAFLTVEIRKKESNALLVKGEHTKHFINAP